MWLPRLLEDLGDDPGAHRLASLSQGEAQAVGHGHGVDELDVQGGVLAGRHHLHALLQVARAGHVGGTEEKLRPAGVDVYVCVYAETEVSRATSGRVDGCVSWSRDRHRQGDGTTGIRQGQGQGQYSREMATRHSPPNHKVGRGKTRQGKTRQDKPRQGKTRQGKARLD